MSPLSLLVKSTRYLNKVFSGLVDRGFYWVGAGICLAFALADLNWWWLSVPGLLGLFLAVTSARSLKGALLGGVLTGTIAGLGAISWFWAAYPVVWLQLEPGLFHILLVVFYWLNVALFVGYGSFFFTGSLYLLYRRFGLAAFYFAPFLWVLNELFGSLTFSLLSYGPGAYLNFYFSFHYLGYLVAHVEWLKPLAALFGVYGLSFFVALNATLGFLLIEGLYRRAALAWFLVEILILLVINNMGLVIAAPAETGTAVLAVDTKFSSTFMTRPDAWDIRYRELGVAVYTALQQPVDIILLPEDARLTKAFSGTEALLKELMDLPRATPDILLVDSARISISDDDSILRAFYYDLAREKVYEVDKQYLVPQGEFVPYLASAFFTTIQLQATLDRLEKNQNYRPGPLDSYASLPEKLPGILFCFESISPVGVWKVQKERSTPFVLHPISHAWFHQTTKLQRKLDVMLSVQALWNRTAIVSAGNMAESKLYGSDGSVKGGQVVAESEFWTLRRYSF